MKNENEVLYKQNENLTKKLRAEQVKNNGLYGKVATLDAELKKLGFDILFPLGTAWDEFVSKWKNSHDFYFKEGPFESIFVPTGDDVIVDPTVTESIEVVKREGRENKA
ncbi:hypothetical protein PVK06_040856 [Gossypium arboreum]|uniref:Uncharacterized protein n=1 Tax=Gossypium arboreum TaxID=29729 RepID=A0ABR0N9G3_GOSAR|nr:hypothetical protein PVK06_040856 [Gossypium arboreum]